jgi:hypothetical protein
MGDVGAPVTGKAGSETLCGVSMVVVVPERTNESLTAMWQNARVDAVKCTVLARQKNKANKALKAKKRIDSGK